jgi:parallel beta-helix repeat protein
MHPEPRLRRCRVVLFSLLIIIVGAALPASADQRGPIRQIHRPTVITRPGHYVLGFSFASAGAGAAIEIRASDVTLDLDGHTLTGPGGKIGVGVLVAGATNVRVSGGALRRFGVGVQVDGATNVRVDGLQIDGEDLGGTPPAVEVGILLVDSRGVVVEHNTVTDTFLGIFVRGEGSQGNRIAENTLVGGANGELGVCYNPAPEETSGGPSGDLVYANHVASFNRGIALSADSAANLILENRLAVHRAAIEEATPGSNVIEDNQTAGL